MHDSMLENNRYFLKDSIRKTIDFSKTDQNRRVAPPPVEKPYDSIAERIDLIPPSEFPKIADIDLLTAIGQRRSRRSYQEIPLSLVELSFLLWATQGIQRKMDSGHALRTVPSAGARHALETYLCILNVDRVNAFSITLCN